MLVATYPAVAAYTACALDGLYTLSAAISSADSQAQLAGYLTFVPPASCLSGTPGVAHFSIELVYIGGNPAPTLLQGDLPYWVDQVGRVAIGERLLAGYLGEVGDRTANGVVLMADPSLAQTTAAIVGVAMRTEFPASTTGTAGPTGPQGPAGPAGATGA